MVDVLFTAASGVGFSPGVGNMRAPRLALSTLEVGDEVLPGDVVATVSVVNPGLGTWSFVLVDDAGDVFDLDGDELLAGDEIDNDDEAPTITISAFNGPKTVTQEFTLSKGGGGPFVKWKSALNLVRTGTGRAKVLVFGDSLTAGLGASAGGTAVYTDAFNYSLPAGIGERLALRGLPFSLNSMVGLNIPSPSTAYTAYNPRGTVGAGWGSGTKGLGGGLMQNTTTTNSIVFTPDGNVDTIDIYYATTTSAGVFSYTLDGGAAVNVNALGANGFAKITVPMTLGPHTLSIARVSGAVFIAAVDAYDSTASEISIWNGGFGGMTAAQNNVAGPWTPAAQIAFMAPDLTLIEFGTNESLASLDPSGAYMTAIQNLAAAAASVGSAVILGSPRYQGSDAATYPITAYNAVGGAVAAANNYSFINVADRFGSYAAANASGFYTSDGVHLNRSGYTDWATMIDGIIGPV